MDKILTENVFTINLDVISIYFIDVFKYLPISNYSYNPMFVKYILITQLEYSWIKR